MDSLKIISLLAFCSLKDIQINYYTRLQIALQVVMCLITLGKEAMERKGEYMFVLLTELVISVWWGKHPFSKVASFRCTRQLFILFNYHFKSFYSIWTLFSCSYETRKLTVHCYDAAYYHDLRFVQHIWWLNVLQIK